MGSEAQRGSRFVPALLRYLGLCEMLQAIEKAALLREEEAAKGLERMMRETESQLRRSR